MYIKSGRQPLYHGTQLCNLVKIIETDTLKCGIPSYDKTDKNNNIKKSISLSRSKHFKEHTGDVRIMLDSDKLKNHGYVSHPVDEISMNLGNAIIAPRPKRKSSIFNFLFPDTTQYKRDPYNYKGQPTSKWNFMFRAPTNKTNIPIGLLNMEIEYEERIYKDIKDIGKYIMTIQFSSITIFNKVKKINDFLEKYPHIVVEINNI